jgi:oxygen-independent coproporphyrinogen-3 oxidase
MILKISGDINRYYVQTLCMVFFPGTTFGQDEEAREGVPEVTVDVSRDEESRSVTAFVSIRLNDRLCEATETVGYDEEITISTHESIAVGRALFAAGKELLGHTPPWGILTGVRPAKVTGAFLAAGKGVLKTKRVLRDEYFLTPQKAALAVSVASTEMKLTKKLDKNSCSLYISIPFCPSR